MSSKSRPDVLIEHWLPVRELSIECMRERGASSALPPLYFLHVWWARRPLTASRAAILAALLPADTDHGWFLHALGIKGDPIAGYQRVQDAKATGERLEGGAYSHKRAFTYSPDAAALTEFGSRLKEHWGRTNIRFLDPMSGGGSIPFEAMRYGLDTWANELNPVASVVLKATLEYPAQFGETFAADIEKWAGEVNHLSSAVLEPFYPVEDGEQVFAYVWAHTVKCPSCGLEVPLSPNWWLERAERRIAAQPVVQGEAVRFNIIESPQDIGFDPDAGSISRGDGRCLRSDCHTVFEAERLREASRERQMGQQLIALVVKSDGTRKYRPPSARDELAVRAAQAYLSEHIGEFEMLGLVPTEQRTKEAIIADRRGDYGMYAWSDFFSPRQLLSHLVRARSIREVSERIRELVPDQERYRGLVTYLAMVFDKSIDYNSVQCGWHPSRQVLSHTFDRHDFSMKWSFGEFDAARNLWPWATDQVLDAYKSLSRLAAPYTLSAHDTPSVHVTQGNAATYYGVDDGSVDVIVVDPPYYDNVMYAECSDFFYVWQKRLLGDVHPDLFSAHLTDKQQEAVANVALFQGRKNPRELAKQDYEDKMRAAFRRMHSLLRDDGVMVVMFTHKQTEAWDSLATALIQGGWEITASWPVHTESEHSLHQAKKNAAQSTILLVCRKRDTDNGGGWWTHVKSEVASHVQKRIAEYEALGIQGVDLMLSAFGPALQIVCKHWPVRLASGENITPEYALDLAREVAWQHRWAHLSGHSTVNVDRTTRFVIGAWDTYKAEQIRFDEANKLAKVTGVDIEDLKRRKLVEKSGEYLALLSPEQRERKHGFDPEKREFESTIDGLQAALWWFRQGGLGAVKSFLGRTRLHTDSQFLAGVQAYLRALPAVRDEYKALREIADFLQQENVDIPPEKEDQMKLEL